MPISHDMLHAAVRIIGDYPPGVFLTRRTVIGTGFIVTVRSERDAQWRHGYVVTTAHNLRDQRHIEVQAPNPGPEGGLYDPITITDWKRPVPGVDIAVAPWVSQSDDRHFTALSMEDVFLADAAAPLYLSLGMTVYYIGILGPLDRPMVRAGTLGAIDQESIPHQDETFSYKAHLVDCRSYGGFSGSPCFSLISLPTLLPKPPPSYEARVIGESGGSLPLLGDMFHVVRLCGMFTQHLADKAPGGPVSLYGVGVMLRSQEIRRALMSKKLKDERQRKDRELPEEEGPGLVETGSAQPGLTRSDFLKDLHRVTRRVDEPPEEES